MKKSFLFEQVDRNVFKFTNESGNYYDKDEDQFDTVLSDDETQVAVRFRYIPFSRGSREKSSGIQLEPDESANVEILSVKTEKGEEIIKKLSSAEIERLEDEAFEYVESERSNALERDEPIESDDVDSGY